MEHSLTNGHANGEHQAAPPAPDRLTLRLAQRRLKATQQAGKCVAALLRLRVATSDAAVRSCKDAAVASLQELAERLAWALGFSMSGRPCGNCRQSGRDSGALCAPCGGTGYVEGG